jgi:exo-poly-alpha-galacturonosidase
MKIKSISIRFEDSLLLIFILLMSFFKSAFGSNCKLANEESGIFSLSAPPLGITSSSAILLWDDTYIPDYTDTSSGYIKKMYYIYQDGIKVGSTMKRSFTVKGLIPLRNYTFTVTDTERIADISIGKNTIQVTIKAEGEIYNVKKFGAKGDGKRHDTEAIQKAINICTKGGKVVIPAGIYLVDHIELKSDMTLEFEKDAVLTFIGYNEGGNYPVINALLPGPDGDVVYRNSSLITGHKVHNVTITGEGTIDANGDTWWPFADKIQRPFTIEFILSSNILVQGITIQDPPAWNNHLVYVDNAIYSEVKFFKVSIAPGRNGDGLNPDASHNILIVGCLFGNQDDSIAIKCGSYLSDGNKRRRGSENIIIRDCLFDGNAASGSSPLGIGIGSEISGGVKHVVIQNCEFIDAASLLNIKTNRLRPFAYVEDVRIENIVYSNTKQPDKKWNRAPISVDHFYYAPEGYNPSVPESFSSETPVFRNIHFKNISILNPVGKGIYLSGLAESPVHNITFNKILVRSRDGMIIQNVDTLVMQWITIIPVENP